MISTFLFSLNFHILQSYLLGSLALSSFGCCFLGKSKDVYSWSLGYKDLKLKGKPSIGQRCLFRKDKISKLKERIFVKVRM